MGELQQTAAVLGFRHVTYNQFRRQIARRRHDDAGFDERTLQILCAEVDHRSQSGGATNSASLTIARMHTVNLI